MKKKLVSLFMVICMIISLTACSSNESDESDDTKTSDMKWSIYWYLCGSNLESDNGAATADLDEMLQVKLPDNVQVIIETGGAVEWQNDNVSADKLGRYIYDSEGFREIEQVELENMGSKDTLEDFLSFAKEKYPADKEMLVFWNHGGGSVTGAAFDELFNNDSLTLDEMHEAIGSVYDLSSDNQPLELVGFDTCLMSTVDVASTFSDISKYLIASEETEPGNGWYYSGWLQALADNSDIGGEELGKTICDTYVEGCEKEETQDAITLAVTDLSKVNKVLEAYETFGKEALSYACENPSFFAEFARIAFATENYGGNTKEQGFSNMVDLGHLARACNDILPNSSKSVLDALKDCIVYKINGQYRTEATGLSCYYSYNGDIEDFNGYTKMGVGEAFKYFYEYGLTGKLSEAGMKYIADMEYDSVPEINTLKSMDWDNHAVTVDNDGNAILTLGDKANDMLSGIYFQLYYMDTENDAMYLLGRDNDIVADWDNGIFKDNFRGVWGAIDGSLVYMELSYEGEDYNLYSIPVILNDEEMNLCVVYDFKEEAYSILGARKPIDDSGMADKNLLSLKEGDTIKTIHYVSSISSEDDSLQAIAVDTIKVTKDTAFTEIQLGDGNYAMIFEMTDAQGNSAYSDVVCYNVSNGNITTSVGIN